MARIVTNTSANTVFKNYTRNSTAMASSMEKLATGLKINRASDDPSGLAISETLRAQVKATDAALDNIANANNFINTLDGFLQTANDILGRMKELSVKMGDGTLSTNDKSNVSAEYNQLSAELTSMNTNAKFNGTQLFNGASFAFTVDSEGTQFSISSGTAALPTPASMASSSNGTTELSTISGNINTVTTARGNLGAAQSRLQFLATSQSNYSENLSATESRIRNVDVAKESANFTKFQILTQAGVAMLAQANSSSQSVMGLLR